MKLKNIAIVLLILITTLLFIQLATERAVAGNYPSITYLDPASKTAGGPGFTMTVAGTNFWSYRDAYTGIRYCWCKVKWNGQNLTTHWQSSTSITADVSASRIASAGTASIVVVNAAPDGSTGSYSSNEETFTINNPAPTTTGLSPISKVAGESGFTLTVNGAKFVDGVSHVQWNGSGRTTTYVSGTQLTAAIPASDIATAGTASVTVFNPSPGGGTSNAQTFTVNNPVPTTSGLNPYYKTAGDASFTLTVNGSGFVQTSLVRWNGYGKTTNYLSPTRLTVPIPASDIATAGTAHVTVFNPGPGGGESNAQTFTVTVLGQEPPLPIPPVATHNPIWYLAEGSTDWGYNCYITIENPNPTPVTAHVSYMTKSGPREKADLTLPASSQTTVNPKDDLGATDFSTRVTCKDGNTIAVDRTMTWTGPGAASPEAHSSTGVTSPETNWYLPEGSTAWGFECWLVIQNPNTSEATCTVTYMIEGAGAKTVVKKVPASSRATFNVADDVKEKDTSIKVTSDIPVIPERAMYRNNRREGHDSIGTTTPATDYYLAEGTTAWGFTTYVLVQNPNDTPANVTVTYMVACKSRSPTTSPPSRCPPTRERPSG